MDLDKCVYHKMCYAGEGGSDKFGKKGFVIYQWSRWRATIVSGWLMANSQLTRNYFKPVQGNPSAIADIWKT